GDQRSVLRASGLHGNLRRRAVPLAVRRLDRVSLQPGDHGGLRRRQLLPVARDPEWTDGRVPRAGLRIASPMSGKFRSTVLGASLLLAHAACRTAAPVSARSASPNARPAAKSGPMPLT